MNAKVVINGMDNTVRKTINVLEIGSGALSTSNAFVRINSFGVAMLVFQYHFVEEGRFGILEY